MHDMPDFLGRKNRSMSDADLKTIRNDLSQAGRATGLVPEIGELRIAVREARGDRRRSASDVAKRIMRLLSIRSRLDRTAWNMTMNGPDGFWHDPRIKDWDVRHQFLVSIGIAFEDMPEVLETALKNGDGDSADAALLWRATDAYRYLAIAPVPEAWADSGVEHWSKSRQNEAMQETWTDLCDEIADIVDLPPRYGFPAT
jgi:hypothetical protein